MVDKFNYKNTYEHMTDSIPLLRFDSHQPCTEVADTWSDRI